MTDIFKPGASPFTFTINSAAVAHTTLVEIGNAVTGVLFSFVQKESGDEKVWLNLVVQQLEDLPAAQGAVERAILNMLPLWMNIGFRWMTPFQVADKIYGDRAMIEDLLKTIDRYKALVPDLEAADETLETLRQEDEDAQKPKFQGQQAKIKINGKEYEGAISSIHDCVPIGVHAGDLVEYEVPDSHVPGKIGPFSISCTIKKP